MTRSTVIDAFTHHNPSGVLGALSSSSDPEARKAAAEALSVSRAFPQFSDVTKRIADMDRFDIKLQVAMMNNMADPNMFSFSAERLLRLCKGINEEMAELAGNSRGRIVALGTVPLAALEEGGIEEMERAVRDLGLKGFMVLTNIRGRPIDEFGPFWEKAEGLGAVVYIHPADPVVSQRAGYQDEFELSRVLGWPYETAIALTRLVLKGTLTEHPRLKVVTHHMGGMIPFLSGRIGEWFTRVASPLNRTRLFGAKVSDSAVAHFRRFYHDTTVGGSLAALRCGYEVFGAKRIVFATDYPWGPEGGRGRLRLYPKLIRRLGLPAAETADIFENNITKILGI